MKKKDENTNPCHDLINFLRNNKEAKFTMKNTDTFFKTTILNAYCSKEYKEGTDYTIIYEKPNNVQISAKFRSANLFIKKGIHIFSTGSPVWVETEYTFGEEGESSIDSKCTHVTFSNK